MSIILAIVCILSLNMHFINVQKQDSVSENLTVLRCFDRKYSNPFYANVWAWIEMLVSFLIPSIFLLIRIITIIIRLRRKVAYTCEVTVVSQTAAKRPEEGKRLVILLNMMYIICMLLAFMFALIMHSCFSDYSTNSLFELFAVIVSICMYVNNTIILLYIFLGARFRYDSVWEHLLSSYGMETKQAQVNGSAPD